MVCYLTARAQRLPTFWPGGVWSGPPARPGWMWVCVRAARARCPFADELFWRRISSQSALLEAASLLALVGYAVSVMSPAGAGSPRRVPPTGCAGAEGSSGEIFSFAAAADARRRLSGTAGETRRIWASGGAP